MKINIVDTEDDLDRLEIVWNDLTDLTPSPFFSSFDYVRTAWHHFHGDNDRLFILVLSEANTILGIAPFYITQRRRWGIPCRTIQFISSWEGDRPQILHTCSARDAWTAILNYLREEFKGWEVLDLMEQPVDWEGGLGKYFLPRNEWYWESQADAIDYYISLRGSWDEYLSGLSANTRKNFRKQTRRLSTVPGGYAVERIAEPIEIHDALERFIALEQASWKAGTKIGVAKDDRHQRFYKDLANRLAGKEQVMFHFLKIGEEDVAGTVCFLCKDVVYGRHTAYLKLYAEYSPGMVLHAEIIRAGFMGQCCEFDLLGIKADGNTNNYKVHWATGKREATNWIIYRVWSRLLPLIVVKRLRKYLTRLYHKVPEGS